MTPGCFDATNLAIFALDVVLKPTTLMLWTIPDISFQVLKIYYQVLLLLKPYRMEIRVRVEENDHGCIDL